MLKSPKVKKILGIALLIAAGTAAFVLTQTDLIIPQKSTATLTASQNKFELNFDISQKDKLSLEEIARKLSIAIPNPPVGFELDSTTSAKLAFKTPINANFNAHNDQITFEGNFKGPRTKLLAQENFKVPESTILAVFAQDLKSFAKSKLILQEEVEKWLDETFASSSGQYLIIFTENANWAIITKNSSASPSSLTGLTDAKAQPVYKEEQVDDVNLGLLNVKAKDTKDTTIGLFIIGENVYLVSTPEAAKELIKSQNKTIDFKLPPSSNQVSANILLTNKNRELPENFYNLFALDQNRLEKYLNKIEKLELILKENKFSGLVVIR